MDVRDVAVAHVLAMQEIDLCGRFLCCKETLSMNDVVEILKGDFPELEGQLPRKDWTNSFMSAMLKCFAGCSLPKGQAQFTKYPLGFFISSIAINSASASFFKKKSKCIYVIQDKSRAAVPV